MLAIGVAGGLAAVVVAVPATHASLADSSTASSDTGTTGATTSTTATSPPTAAITFNASGGATFHSGSILLQFSQPTDVSWYIEYGTTASYGSMQTQSTHGGGAGGQTSTAISLSGLQPGTLYHFQAVVTAPTAWSSGDLTFATLPVAPPVLQFRAPPECELNNVGGPIMCSADTIHNTKGLDVTWYVAAATRSDFSDAVSGPPVVIPASECDCMELGNFDTDITPNFPAPASNVVYVQLHASNAAGSITSPVVTVSPVLLAPSSTKATTTAPPPPPRLPGTSTTPTTTAPKTSSAPTATSTTTTTNAPRPGGVAIILGKAHLLSGGVGWGTARPKRIFNGGDPSGLAFNLRWHGWGSSSAYAYGLTWINKPGGGYYPKPGAIELRASKVGRCKAGGASAYTRLEARVVTRPGGKLGKWFAWGGWKTICRLP